MTGRPAGDAFHRPKGGPFDDLAKEQFARERARGTSNLKTSASVAGIGLSTAAVWEKHPAVIERVRELRADVDDFVGVTKAWVLAQLKQNVDDAREAEQFKASNEALMLLYKILSEDKGVGASAARMLSPSTSARDVQAKLREAFSRPTKALPTSSDQMPPADEQPVDTSGEEMH